MALASILGGLAGGAASLGQQALSQYFVGQNMAAQYKYWKKAQLNEPSLRREGLEKAGYNPMLALTGGSASFTPSVSAYTPDIVSSAKAGSELARDVHKMNDLAVEQAEADIKKTEAETDSIKQGQFKDIQSLILSKLAKWVEDPHVREMIGSSAKSAAESAQPNMRKSVSAIGEFVQKVEDEYKSYQRRSEDQRRRFEQSVLEKKERIEKARREKYVNDNYKMPDVPRNRPTRSSRKSSKANRPKGGWYNGRLLYGAPSI